MMSRVWRASHPFVMLILYSLPVFACSLLVSGFNLENYLNLSYPTAGTMWDLQVYLRTVHQLFSAESLYGTTGTPQAYQLPFVYPPFAALAMAVLNFASIRFAQVIWLFVASLCIVFIVQKLGLKGPYVALTGMATVLFLYPFQQALLNGQVTVTLMFLVVCDSFSGPKIFARRILPEGVLTGIAAAIKLTPLVFPVIMWLSKSRKVAYWTLGTFVALGTLALIVLPEDSLYFWTHLPNASQHVFGNPIRTENQSIFGMVLRSPQIPDQLALVGSAIVLVVGIIAAASTIRNGHRNLGITIGGLASALASPIAWSHAYVWVLPLIVILISDNTLPRVIRVTGLLYALWISFAPYKLLQSIFQVKPDIIVAAGWADKLLIEGGLIIGFGFLLTVLIVNRKFVPQLLSK